MPEQRQVNQIQVRVTDSELRRIQRVAGHEPLASWGRRIMLEYVERKEKQKKARA